MTLGNGHHYLAIPGPSAAPDEVLQAMHRPSPNIYEGELVDMVPGIVRDLKAVAHTDGHLAIYIVTPKHPPRLSVIVSFMVSRICHFARVFFLSCLNSVAPG